ncbi:MULTISPECIES: GntR family transcriptional regulator [Arthrobacter]|uniref:GntR family transcriptional regulator n=2 Tax=Arthrobacter TaxID=1663 RepID=A0ABU9KL13_9MICC|nr:GntR family transcriptional regulator [Arthrobacter sp. YJM1]MDP5226962.1 GntR family transcriptional regulator [Arthrobacter sp. YJM1]
MSSDEVLEGLRREARAAHAETAQWVAAVLRQRIADGSLTPGTKLPEEPFREALGVSRNTLREAFATLHAERVVTRIPNRGVFVAHPTADDVREIYRVRKLVEPAALLWATRLDVAELAAIVRRGRAAVTALDVPGMAGANQEFHRSIVSASGSERLDVLMEQVLAEMRLVFAAMGWDPRFHAPYVEGNERIVALLESGDRSRAAEYLGEYLGRAEEQLLEAVQARG